MVGASFSFSIPRILALCLAAFLFVAASAVLSISGPAAAATPSDAQCEARDNGTVARLVQCINERELWRRLKAFQQIADANPGPNGHGNRNTGTSGYRASVRYVAARMRQAGYRVTIQSYDWKRFAIEGVPVFETRSIEDRPGQDWVVARLSGSGTLTAPIEPPRLHAGANESASGCAAGDFAGFVPGRIALLQRGSCAFDSQVQNAQRAGAAAVIIYNDQGSPDAAGRRERRDGGSYQALLVNPIAIPVIAVVSHALGTKLARDYANGSAPSAHIDVQTKIKSDVDYNVIADSPYGDREHVVVVDAHLDAIFGAGMLDNASGSTTILEIALNLAHSKTRNQLRYIWFGGEELGLLGSHYYTQNLSPAQLKRIAFDVDVDVTATPNFDVLVADPAHAHNVKKFPPNVVPESVVGNDAFADYFASAGIISRNALFGNDGTDSNSFSLVGVPNSGILTQQDCCKHAWEVELWGGYPGNYEGRVPGHNGGCVDWPHRWCDNISNNDPFVLQFISKAVAAVTLKLANDAGLGR